MRTFLQYLKEVDDREGDFTYTTDQGKTDEHVKGFVKNEIDKPQVELQENGVTVSGTLNSKYNRYIQITEDGIAITSDLSKQVTAVVTDLVSKMLDENVVKIRANSTEQDAVPQGSKTNYVLTIVFECDGSGFSGDVAVTLSYLGKETADQLDSGDKCSINIECKWTVTK